MHLVWALYYVYIVVEVTMNMAKYFAVSDKSCKRLSIFELIIRRLKNDIFNGTKCKVCFIYVGFNCKRKKWGKIISRNYVH